MNRLTQKFSSGSKRSKSPHKLTKEPEGVEVDIESITATSPTTSPTSTLLTPPGHIPKSSSRSLSDPEKSLSLSPPGSPKASRSGARPDKAWLHDGRDAVRYILDVARDISDTTSLPGLKPALSTLLRLWDDYDVMNDNEEAMKELFERITTLKTIFEAMQQQSRRSKTNEAWKVCLLKLQEEIEQINVLIASTSKRSAFAKFIKGRRFSIEITNHTRRLESIIQDFQLALQVKQVGLALNADQEQHFRLLQPVYEAAWNSDARRNAVKCLPGTRVELLKEIQEWITGDSRLLFWLNGIAGTGKSTIATSIAEWCFERGILGGSFFFSRDQQSRREITYLFRTLAAQLGNVHPGIKAQIADVLADASILKANPHFQLRKLIIQPILDAADVSGQLVFILDALDECEEPEIASSIVKYFASELHTHGVPLKVFITSRPEKDIRTVFKVLKHEPVERTKSLILHEVQPLDVQKDINLYLSKELMKVKEKNQEIIRENPWPSDDAMQVLLDKAGGLFIYAATMVKFIDTKANPEKHLKMILNLTNVKSYKNNPFGQLDLLYHQVISSLKEAIGDSEELELFPVVIGTIILLFDRMSLDAIAGLLKVDTVEVTIFLRHLHSILIVPEGNDGPIQAYHASLHDYLTDKERCQNELWYIDVPTHHRRLAITCINNMKTGLKENICGLDPSLLNSEVKDLPQRKAEHIPEHLAYACHHWGLHLSKSVPDDEILQLLYDFCTEMALVWIEVLSLTEHLSDGIKMIQKVAKWLESQKGQHELGEILYDLERLMKGSYEVLSIASLQVYHSALPFAPYQTRVFKNYAPKVETVVKVLNGSDPQWSSEQYNIKITTGCASLSYSHNGELLATGSINGSIGIWSSETGQSISILDDGHSQVVNSVAFSYNGKLVASGSDDKTIKIWDFELGDLNCVHVLEGHTDTVQSVAFCPDNIHIASGSGDDTIRIWDVSTGVCVSKADASSNWVRCVQYSPNGKHIGAACHDNTVKIWSGTGLKLEGILEGHIAWITSVSFSADSKQIVSASWDQDVILWDLETKQVLKRMVGHDATTNGAAISMDSKLITSGADDGSIRIWDTKNGKQVGLMTGHTGMVKCVRFSPDGKSIVSGSDDESVRIWDVARSISLSLQVSSDTDRHVDEVKFVAISPDGKHMVSGSHDRTVRLWYLHTGKLFKPLLGHLEWVSTVNFSPDSARVLSASDDKTARIWTVATGELERVLEGHASGLTAAHFSPDGKKIATSSYDFLVMIWDSVTGQVLKKLEGHSSGVRAVDFSPNGELIASGSFDHTLRIWNEETGVALFELKHTNVVNAVTFSSEGKFIMSADDNCVNTWDARTGQLVQSEKKKTKSLRVQGAYGDQDGYTFDYKSGWISYTSSGHRLCWVPPKIAGKWVFHSEGLPLGGRIGVHNVLISEVTL